MKNEFLTLLTASLLLTACSETSSPGATITPPSATMPPTSTSPPPPTMPEPVQAMAALEKLMLTESSNEALTVSETEIDEEEEFVILRDLLFTNPDTGDFIAIDEITITGLLDLLRGVEFDAMTFRGVTSSPTTDGYRLTLGEVSITDVNPSFANFLTRIFSLETPDGFDFTDSLFEGIEFTDVNVEPHRLSR